MGGTHTKPNQFRTFAKDKPSGRFRIWKGRKKNLSMRASKGAQIIPSHDIRKWSALKKPPQFYD
jgi:hypothetical protein